MSEHHVPGLYRCAVCGFELAQSSLRASDGAISDRDNPGERCPNDGHLLGRVTWKLHAEDMAERANEYLSRAVRAEAALSQPLLGEVRFLLDRIAEIDWSQERDAIERDWHGHVAPSIGRISALLAKLSPADGVTK